MMTGTMVRRIAALEQQLTGGGGRRIFWANEGCDIWHKMGRTGGAYTDADLAALADAGAAVIALRIVYGKGE